MLRSGYGRRSAFARSAIASFNPLSLFVSGEQGVWYDPSDFANMFQDSAGTTPVTAVGQPVGKILDKSGRGNHALQATTANRPVLQQDGAGRYYLAFNGTNSSLATAGNVDLTGTAQVSVFAGVRKLSDAARGLLVELGNALTSNGFQINAPSAAATSNYTFLSAGSTQITATATPFAAPLTSVITGQGDIAAPSNTIRVNGAQVASNPASQGSGAFSNNPIYIGARGGSSLFFNGNLYGLIVRGATSNASQIARAEMFMNSKTGAY
jgi:hypothetical protein